MTTAVAIALYNGERFLHKQLESIRNQTTVPNQVVLCDDGSTDNTVAVVREYIKKHNLTDKWTLVVNENNLGYAKNFFKAMSLCQADLIFLCDQDDIWKQDKIEKMTAVMEQNPHIDLLCCKFEIIDGEDRVMHSLLARKKKETFEIRSVSHRELLRGFYWLGMLMCVRTTYLQTLYPITKNLTIAHDRVLSHCAADGGRFYEYQYVGAYHRRHENNTAREEHRIAKLLNLSKKLKEIAVSERLWKDILDSKLLLREESRQQIRERLVLLKQRDDALRSKSLKKVLRLYKNDAGEYLCKTSLLCDIWLAIFGKRKGETL